MCKGRLLAAGENNKIKGDEEDESNIERWFM
jgi:hypothetical protein